MEEWFDTSEYLVLLQVPDEETLMDYVMDAYDRGLAHHKQFEPDFGDEFTALAIQPSLETQRLCANLPLALREAAMA